MEELRNEIHEALTRAREHFTLFQEQISNRDIIIFLGETRSGKSTVINFILGTPLHAFRNEFHEYKISKVDERADGPHIDQGSLSVTAIPGIYPRNHNDFIYVDAPGFGDNRGDAQEIVNAMLVNQIRSARTCKFVLVTDISSIKNDNVSGFVHFIKSMHDLIPHASLCDSISLVVTKVEEEWTRPEIGNLLNAQIILSGINTTVNVKQLVRHLTEHHELIALFRKPTRAGEITTTIEVNIEDAISSSSPLNMNAVAVRPAISDGTRLALLEVCQDFVEELEFDDELNTGISEYRNYFIVPDYVFASTVQELEATTAEINNWISNLVTAKNTDRRNVQELLDSLTGLIQPDPSTTLYRTLTLFAILETVDLIQETINASLQRKYIDSLRNKIEETYTLLNKIKDEQRRRTFFDAALSVIQMGVGAGIGSASEIVANTVAAQIAAASIAVETAAVGGAALETAAVAVVGSALETAAVAVGGAALETAAVAVGGTALETAAVAVGGAALETAAVAVGGAALETAAVAVGGTATNTVAAAITLATPVGALVVGGVAVAATGALIMQLIIRNENARRAIARERQGR